jgi:hypothetical protein
MAFEPIEECRDGQETAHSRRDQPGSELPDLVAARREAVRAAGEMIDDARKSFWEHMMPWNVHVTDSENRLLFPLQFGAKIPQERHATSLNPIRLRC